METMPVFDGADLEAICGVLGHTQSGLKGAEIGQILQRCEIGDIYAWGTKRERLLEALDRCQKKDGNGDRVVAFVQAAMAPVRYLGAPELFHERRLQLDEVLGFSGYAVGNDGKLVPADAVSTLTEAQERASRLRQQLLGRGLHPDILPFCGMELLQDDYFHAVLEATKSVADKIREMSGLTSDGARLVDQAFSLGKDISPMLAFNRLQTFNEQSEQRGLILLMKGLFGTFRNPAAHAPRIAWSMEEQDVLDIFSLISLLHRRLDEVTPYES